MRSSRPMHHSTSWGSENALPGPGEAGQFQDLGLGEDRRRPLLILLQQHPFFRQANRLECLSRISCRMMVWGDCRETT